MAQPSPQTDSEQFGTNLHPANDAACATALSYPVRQSEGQTAPTRLIDCTPSEWDAIEARAVACMRVQLVRYHLKGGMDNAADYDRARNSWALIVMNRERITRDGTA